MFTPRTNWPLEQNRLSRALEEHRRSGKTLIDLTASNPTTCGFDYPEREILTALSDRRALLYSPESKGLLKAREAVADYYRGQTGFLWRGVMPDGDLRLDPEHILLTSGTSEAYSYIFALLCEKDDEVLVPEPSYPLFEFLADLADIHLVPYPLLYDHGWQIDLESLRDALTPRSRAILVVHPNNPTGSFVKPQEAAALAEMCARRKMAIVADEVFLDYFSKSDAAKTTPPASFALSTSGLTFTLSGISKVCALPQMKLAWMISSGPQALVRGAVERLEIIADTYLSPSTPIQLALPVFLRLRGGLQEQLQRRIAKNLAFLDDALRQNGGPVTRLVREGGWYAVVRVPASHPDDALAVTLLEHCSVLVHPGQFFNFAQEGFLVLSLITREEQFQEGVRRLLSFIIR